MTGAASARAGARSVRAAMRGAAQAAAQRIGISQKLRIYDSFRIEGRGAQVTRSAHPPTTGHSRSLLDSVRRDRGEHRLPQQIRRKQPLRQDGVVETLRGEAGAEPRLRVAAQFGELQIPEEV